MFEVPKIFTMYSHWEHTKVIVFLFFILLCLNSVHCGNGLLNGNKVPIKLFDKNSIKEFPGSNSNLKSVTNSGYALYEGKINNRNELKKNNILPGLEYAKPFFNDNFLIENENNYELNNSHKADFLQNKSRFSNNQSEFLNSQSDFSQHDLLDKGSTDVSFIQLLSDQTDRNELRTTQSNETSGNLNTETQGYNNSQEFEKERFKEVDNEIEGENTDLSVQNDEARSFEDKNTKNFNVETDNDNEYPQSKDYEDQLNTLEDKNNTLLQSSSTEDSKANYFNSNDIHHIDDGKDISKSNVSNDPVKPGEVNSVTESFENEFDDLKENFDTGSKENLFPKAIESEASELKKNEAAGFEKSEIEGLEKSESAKPSQDVLGKYTEKKALKFKENQNSEFKYSDPAKIQDYVITKLKNLSTKSKQNAPIEVQENKSKKSLMSEPVQIQEDVPIQLYKNVLTQFHEDIPAEAKGNVPEEPKKNSQVQFQANIDAQLHKVGPTQFQDTVPTTVQFQGNVPAQFQGNPQAQFQENDPAQFQENIKKQATEGLTENVFAQPKESEIVGPIMDGFKGSNENNAGNFIGEPTPKFEANENFALKENGPGTLNPIGPGEFNPNVPGGFNPNVPGGFNPNVSGGFNPIGPGEINPNIPGGFNPIGPGEVNPSEDASPQDNAPEEVIGQEGNEEEEDGTENIEDGESANFVNGENAGANEDNNVAEPRKVKSKVVYNKHIRGTGFNKGFPLKEPHKANNNKAIKDNYMNKLHSQDEQALELCVSKVNQFCFDNGLCWPVWVIALGLFSISIILVVTSCMNNMMNLFDEYRLTYFYRAGGNWLLVFATGGIIAGSFIGGIIGKSLATALLLGGGSMVLAVSIVLIGKTGAYIGAYGGALLGGTIGFLVQKEDFITILIGTGTGLLIGVILGFAPIFRKLKINQKYIQAKIRKKEIESFTEIEADFDQRNRKYRNLTTSSQQSSVAETEQSNSPKMRPGPSSHKDEIDQGENDQGMTSQSSTRSLVGLRAAFQDLNKEQKGKFTTMKKAKAKIKPQSDDEVSLGYDTS